MVCFAVASLLLPSDSQVANPKLEASCPKPILTQVEVRYKKPAWSHNISDPAGRQSAGRVELELVVTRQSTEGIPGRQTHAKLLVGCANDDRVLLHEHIVLESFPSPYKVIFFPFGSQSFS